LSAATVLTFTSHQTAEVFMDDGFLTASSTKQQHSLAMQEQKEAARDVVEFVFFH
jgi:hypothetical protein